jgi:hypothetical protein
MKIRNPHLLKKPWLFPICTALGAALGLFEGGTHGLSIITLALILIGTGAAVNAWFFISLRKTLVDQAVHIPDTNAEPTKKRLRYLLFGIGLIAVLYGGVLYVTGRTDLARQILPTASLCFLGVFVTRPKAKRWRGCETQRDLEGMNRGEP